MMTAEKLDERLAAAEEVCWALMVMIGLGEGLEEMPLEWRPWLGEPLQKWAHLAVETGILPAGSDDET